MAAELRPPYKSAEKRPVLTATLRTPESRFPIPSSYETVLTTDSLVLLTGTAHPALAQRVGRELAKIIDEPITVFEATSRFPDGEIKVSIEPNLRRRHVFFIQGAPGIQRIVETENGPRVTPSVNDAVEEINLLVDAATRASAQETTVVTPYSFYSRQDRKARSREPISAARIAANYAHAGADRIVTMDLHAEQEQGFANIPWDNVYASKVLVPEIEKLKLSRLVVAAPDAGGVKRAEKYVELLSTDEPIAVIFKKRNVHDGSVTAHDQIIGDVKGKPVLIVDDIISSGKTAKQAAELLLAEGATDVYLAVAHALLSDESMNNLGIFTHVFFTDSVNHEGIELLANMSEVTIAPLLAETIKRIQTGESISEGIINNPNPLPNQNGATSSLA